MKTPRTTRLQTPFKNSVPDWDTEYPRPQMVRDSFLSLNGYWKLFSVRKNQQKMLGTLLVPFPPESAFFGIEHTPQKDEHYIYETTFCKRRKALFESAVKETLFHLYNHPCICYYTIFNEGWGQYDADRIYTECKAMDSTRIFDSTSGWFEEKNSDVKSEHIYFKPINLKPSEKPLVLSEFGGYSCKIEEHSFNLDRNYGYRFFKDRESFMNALEMLYREEIIPAIEKSGLGATVLTQVSDVEDETNGLLTYDRQVLKVDEIRMQNIAKDIQKAFQKIISES
ncbi:MAG: hypothetical protein IJ489_07075 [Clostridia bacterium]|nr:hypothetical protein [Clostridia bacterium]